MIFIDTGAFLARHIERDQHHHRARKAWRRLAAGEERCLTTNFVLDETFTLLARRAGYRFAAERARSIYTSRAVIILRPGEEEEFQAIELFERYADQEVSLTDCVSFVLMKRAGIKRAFTFDRHFEDAGFQRWP